MTIEMFGITDQGLVREMNEDGLLIDGKILKEGALTWKASGPDFLVAVADGLGGVKSGEIASEICMEELSVLLPPFSVDQVLEKLQQIHRKILAYGEANPQSRGLATTVAGLFSAGGDLYTFHVGDSRVYRYRNGFLKQITADHSLVQMLFESGKITREELDTHPNKHIVTNVLGGKSQADVVPEIERVRGEFLQGDLFLLCTDGLSDLVSLEEMETILSENQHLEAAGMALVEKANEKGGYDNISIILVKNTEQ